MRKSTKLFIAVVAGLIVSNIISKTCSKAVSDYIVNMRKEEDVR